MKLFNVSRVTTVIVVAFCILSGCAVNMKVALKEPTPSVARFETTAEPTPVTLEFRDDRSDEDG